MRAHTEVVEELVVRLSKEEANAIVNAIVNAIAGMTAGHKP